MGKSLFKTKLAGDVILNNHCKKISSYSEEITKTFSKDLKDFGNISEYFGTLSKNNFADNKKGYKQYKLNVEILKKFNKIAESKIPMANAYTKAYSDLLTDYNQLKKLCVNSNIVIDETKTYNDLEILTSVKDFYNNSNLIIENVKQNGLEKSYKQFIEKEENAKQLQQLR